ncbi:hypothetical protein [Shewanella oncorhynchi]|uniref:hypothetical protein n=1 Tax=Shewanella oncorhynchi TaxID=2726434 RepID=UPI003D7935A5
MFQVALENILTQLVNYLIVSTIYSPNTGTNYMNKTSYILLLIALSGCTSGVQNTKNASLPTKVITNEIANNSANKCSFIGVSVGTVYNMFQSANDNVSDAQLKASQNAESNGANAIIIKNVDVQSPGHNVTVTVDTYSCQLITKQNN